MRRARAALLTVVASLAAGGCGGTERLRLESYLSPQTGQELIVSVPEEVNVPETAGGRAEVELECFDRRRERVIRETHPWPFSADGVGNELPHAHQRGLPQLLDRVARCRLLGTDPALEGELPLAR